MDKTTILQQPPPEVESTVTSGPATGVFPTTAPHSPGERAWKSALVLLLAGGTLTACGGLGGGAVYRGPFGRHEAAHLLRRAAARGNAEEADHLASLGLEGAVDALLDVPELMDEGYIFDLDEDRTAHRNAWVNHWLNTATPAAERLTMFWHGHFATEASAVGWREAALQINKLRELGQLSLRDLLYMVAADPAMLIYLDNRSSTKEHPNENWARELLELFTLGEGHYTERDIQEIARAFTGWTVTWTEEQWFFTFNARMHDFEPKTVLGKTVHNTFNPEQEGYEVLDILLDMPQTYRFVASKLLRYYLHPNPDEQMVRAGADILKGGTVRDFLKWLFMHPEFYADEARNALVKSPVEYVVGLLYAAGKREVPLDSDLSYWLYGRLDQDPFNPPDVSGWPLGTMDWLSDSLLLQRLKFIEYATTPPEGGSVPGPIDYSVFMDGAVNALSLVAPEAQLL